mmetsp:Transcript_26124/g.60915  ORF Transcript_26124/g.60915 Transcript_26124/m.60915 type:complete len:156 (-) Transcript_26124:86-553(-)
MAYNRRRWGGDGWTMSLRRMGAAVGAKFSNWVWWPSTMQSHRLVLFAEAKGISTSETKAALFQALYEEGKNVSKNDELADIAASKLGLDRQEVLSYLESSDGKNEVIRQIRESREVVDHGVPHFVIMNDKGQGTEVGGAASPDNLLKAMTAVSKA